MCKDTRTSVHCVVVYNRKQPGSVDQWENESLNYGAFVQWDPGAITLNERELVNLPT